MSRAVRRQQAKEPAGQAGRGGRDSGRPRPPRIGGGGASQPPGRGARPLAARRRFAWFEDIIAELKKVTWPTLPETRYLTTVVIIVAVAVGFALGLIDIFFNWLIDRLLLQ